MFPKRNRLNRKDVKNVIKNFEYGGNEGSFRLSAKKNNLGYFRFGFIISSKIIKSAVDRITLKRKIIGSIERNIFWKSTGCDCIIRCISMPIDNIDKNIMEILGKLLNWYGSKDHSVKSNKHL